MALSLMYGYPVKTYKPDLVSSYQQSENMIFEKICCKIGEIAILFCKESTKRCDVSKRIYAGEIAAVVKSNPAEYYLQGGSSMAELFEIFPYLKDDHIIIRKMVESDVDSLIEITNNPNVYRYIQPFLYQKSKTSLLTAIKNLGNRDFNQKKRIIAGIYLSEEPEKLIGLAEMFDYKKRMNQMTIGYCINESYWHKGIATDAVKLMKNYLCNDICVQKLKAFVMPENVLSEKVLIKNGFIKEQDTVQSENWGGRETVVLNVFTYANQ